MIGWHVMGWYVMGWYVTGWYVIGWYVMVGMCRAKLKGNKGVYH